MGADAAGRSFRGAWIAGVRKYFPGEPKPSYVAPWDEMPDWERDSATGVYELVRTLIATSQGATAASRPRTAWIYPASRHTNWQGSDA